MEKKNYSAKKVGFLQALGIAVYVSIFATSAYSIGKWADATGFELPDVAQIAVMLTVFIVSATICASLMFAYPITRFIKGERKEAYQTVAWTVGWLVVFLAVFGLVATSL